MRKGQSQLVTAVLLTGIMVILVSSVYLWGVPLIQKQKDTVNLNNMETFMKDLNSKIEKVASTGGREKIENVKIPGELRINNLDRNDSIVLEFDTNAELIASGVDIYLIGSNQTSVSISQPAGALKVFSENLGGKYDISMTLSYREVVSGIQCHKINLEVGGRTVVGEGNHDVIITESGSRRIEDECSNGNDMFVTDVTIRFE